MLSPTVSEVSTGRSMRTQADLVDQLFNSSEKRLAVLLLMAEFGEPGEPETLIPQITQETLAEMIGTTRSRVSFFMNRFRKLALAVSARDRGDYSAAQSNFERSLACWRMLPDRLALARCLHNLANVVKVRGDYPRARWALREAADIFEELGDRTGGAWSINQQGDIARDRVTWLPLENCINARFQSSGKPETRGVPRGL